MTDDTSDKFTIKVPRTHGEEHNERRKDLGLTWAEYLDNQAPDVPGVDAESLAADIAARIDTAAFDGGLSDADAADILGRLEDLEASLPAKTAEEVHSRR